MSEIIKEIELEKIRHNRLNPRLDINIERLNELDESISTKRKQESKYEINSFLK